jgi:hypothetical protein
MGITATSSLKDILRRVKDVLPEELLVSEMDRREPGEELEAREGRSEFFRATDDVWLMKIVSRAENNLSLAQICSGVLSTTDSVASDLRGSWRT